ncbi:hypothetical protein EW026_g1724 [Hermanssonia centrifuga]|uniref:Uncharacterized protein n=2 Tax=Hermanssonia centrifuga TaxID=98765 RepID=A0A2R6PGA7_9APHY|nr:hypothetical protein PHLCEN_2v4800 [Hermanssonia centrifuga]THH00858.1 hypothetical protein EW026_g1724 [Hermanssonia centrifuga]
MSSTKNITFVPPEIAYIIVAQTCVQHIDEVMIDDHEAEHPDSDNPIIQLLVTSKQIRDVTRKVISDALGLKQLSDGR